MILNLINHYLNPLHIYCRLIDCGIAKDFARDFVSTYEKFYKPIFN